MREYAIVRPAFWIGPTGRELRRHPAEVRELAAYLFSCPNHEQYGLYYKSIDTMAQETGRSEKCVQASLLVLKSLDYCVYDTLNEWVWVFEMAQIQMGLPLKGADYRVKAANKWYQGLPRNVHLGPFFDRYCDALHLDPPRRDWATKSDLSVRKQIDGEGALESVSGSPMPLISIQDQSPVLVVPEKRSVHTERFERFWAVYPKKVGRKGARIEWDAIKPDDELTAKICAAVERHKTSGRWLRDNGVAIPDPERYIKKERWNDNYEAGPSVSKQTLKNVTGPLGSFLDGRDQ